MPRPMDGSSWYLCLEHLCQDPWMVRLGICVWNTYANDLNQCRDSKSCSLDIQ
ncbi:hypothetical protein [Shewanella fidelis]|uniref:hypothetical protein n=1 Tax=Shewanella fidelis TaxID=173509 RepID=UPI0012EBB9D6|nr:hypothetical protein [Shewanella fidelis]